MKKMRFRLLPALLLLPLLLFGAFRLSAGGRPEAPADTGTAAAAPEPGEEAARPGLPLPFAALSAAQRQQAVEQAQRDARAAAMAAGQSAAQAVAAGQAAAAAAQKAVIRPFAAGSS